MAVIQPLYFAGGRYSAGVDRKLLAALLKPASDGTRLEGVIPAYTGSNSLKVAPSSGMVLSIATGLCIIADSATQDVDTPGVYLAGVDTSAETVTIASNTSGAVRYDLVYADVSETSYTITNRAYSGSTVTLTTSAAHGFVTGQTVYISGIDEFYDGAFVIASVPSTTTFTYTKASGSTADEAVLPTVQLGSTLVKINNKSLTSNVATITTSTSHGLTTASNLNDLITVKGVDSTFDGTYHILTAATNTITYKINRNPLADVSSTAVTSSSVAKARVPFAIKVTSSTSQPSLPSGTNIKLAVVTVANGASSIALGDISDRRQFVTTTGGVHLWDSSVDSVTYPTVPEGSLRYDLDSASENAATANTLQYYDGSSWKTISTLTLSGNGVATTAAKSDHTHSADTTHLGISQVRNSDGGGSGTSVPVFPSSSDTTTLDASSKYLFEAVLYCDYTVSPSNRLGFTLSPSTAFTAVNLNFIVWDWVESASITRSGYQSGTSSAITDVTASTTSDSVVINIKGVVVTDSSSTTVTPSLTLPVSGSINVYKGSYVKFTNIGSSSTTVIRGTWTS